MPQIPTKKPIKKPCKKLGKKKMTRREYADQLNSARLNLGSISDQLAYLAGELGRLHMLLYTETLVGPITETKDDIPF